MTRSTEECEISRSCQSGTFSNAACAFERTIRASPEICSQVMGFRLCGIADDPFARTRTAPPPRALRFAADAGFRAQFCRGVEAIPAKRRNVMGVQVARNHLGRDGSCAQAQPLADSLFGLGVRYARTSRPRPKFCPPGSLPQRSRTACGGAPVRPTTARAFSPNVIGSAWMPWVRPIWTVCLCSKARAFRPPSNSSRPVARSAAEASRSAAPGRYPRRRSKSGRSGASATPRQRLPPSWFRRPPW